MDALQFAYWLQGFTELHGEPPTPEQWAAIKDHLGLVFNKVTPIRAQTAAQPLRLPTDISPWPAMDKFAWPPVFQCQTAIGKADPSILAIC